VKTGPKRHAVAFDMASPAHQQVFVAACEQTLGDLESGLVKWAFSSWLREHVVNAKRAPGRFGVSIRKDHRESAHKIDLAVCLIGARMLWRRWQLEQVGGTKGAPAKGRVILLDD
jgi:hypothetical protein